MNKNSTASITKRRINRTFYPVVKEELLWMRKNGLVTNTGFVYTALRLENPHCDRPIDINVKEFAICWGIPEGSVYDALAKLKDLNALKFISKRVKIQWQQDFAIFDEESTYSQQEEFSENPEFIPKSQNKFCNLRINSVISENQSLEPLPDKDSSIPHTIQTSTDSSESVEEESCGAKAPQDSAIEKPTLKVRDIPEEPLAPSTLDTNLQTHLEAAAQGIEPSKEIVQQLLEHQGYAPTYRQYAKEYGWELPCLDPIPDFALEQMRLLKEKLKNTGNRYRIPK